MHHRWLMSICSTDVPALHIKETAFNIYNGPINAASTKTKCKKTNRRTTAAKRERYGKSSQIQKARILKPVIIMQFMCAMRLLLFCSRCCCRCCSAPHAYCIYKIIDEAHFIVAPLRFWLYCLCNARPTELLSVKLLISLRRIQEITILLSRVIAVFFVLNCIVNQNGFSVCMCV